MRAREDAAVVMQLVMTQCEYVYSVGCRKTPRAYSTAHNLGVALSDQYPMYVSSFQKSGTVASRFH
jgi:hypothetical protein